MMVREDKVPRARSNATVQFKFGHEFEIKLEIKFKFKARRLAWISTTGERRSTRWTKRLCGSSASARSGEAIGALKRETLAPVYEPDREQAVFDHVRAVNSGPLSDSEMQHVYERLIDVMRTLQRRDAGTP